MRPILGCGGFCFPYPDSQCARKHPCSNGRKRHQKSKPGRGGAGDDSFATSSSLRRIFKTEVYYTTQLAPTTCSIKTGYNPNESGGLTPALGRFFNRKRSQRTQGFQVLESGRFCFFDRLSKICGHSGRRSREVRIWPQILKIIGPYSGFWAIKSFSIAHKNGLLWAIKARL
jgi:hypothetical protein